MKRYEVIMDYVMTATIIVDADDTESACDEASRYVHTAKGFIEYVGKAAPRNVILDGEPHYGGDDGFDIPCDPTEYNERFRSSHIDITKEES